MPFILSQIMAALSTIILLTYSVMKVKRPVILICNVIINLLNAGHYLLLGGYTAAVCSVIVALMTFVFSYKGKTKLLSSPALPLAFAAAFIVTGILTWDDAWSLIPVAGHLLLVMAFWCNGENIIKGIFIIVGLMWIVYNAHLQSVTNVIGQVLAVSSNCIYFIRIWRDRRKEKKQA